jgi:hypothetical protein
MIGSLIATRYMDKKEIPSRDLVKNYAIVAGNDCVVLSLKQ